MDNFRLKIDKHDHGTGTSWVSMTFCTRVLTAQNLQSATPSSTSLLTAVPTEFFGADPGSSTKVLLERCKRFAAGDRGLYRISEVWLC